jgi:hypothetical protein
MRSISRWLGHAAVRAQDNSSYLPAARLLWTGEVAVAGEGRFKGGLGRVDSPVLRTCFRGVRTGP